MKEEQRKKLKELAEKKKLDEKDIETLTKILVELTVTRSGMLRVMSYLVQNPDMTNQTLALVEAVKGMHEELKGLRQDLANKEITIKPKELNQLVRGQ